MNLVTKPSAGFMTPYCVVLEDLNQFFLQNTVEELSADCVRTIQQKNFTETNSDIAVPVLLEDGRWETQIISSFNNVSEPITVRFKTVSITTFIQEALALYQHTYQLGKLTDDGYGFYIAGMSHYAVLRVPKDFKFTESLKFNGIEIPVDMYRYDKNNGCLEIDTPIAKGNIYVDLI